MSKYRKIDVRIWNDAKFRDLSHNAKLVFFFLLTHPNMTALGAMRSTLSGLAEELDFDLEAFREAFREAFAKGMVKHDGKACLIALPNFIKYNQPESPNVVKAWVNSLDLLPECDLKNEVISLSANALKGYSKAFREALPEAFLKTYPKSMLNQEQEQEQELNTNNNTRASFEKIETQGEYVAKPVRELFNMTLGWKPNQQTFAAITMRNGLPSEYSDDRLAGFVSYWQAEPVELTQGQWENKFAMYLKRPVLVPKEQPKPKPSPKNQQPHHDEYIQPPLYVPKPKVENPATPEQIKAIMDEMRRKIAGGE
jgi:hypothetical protein